MPRIIVAADPVDRQHATITLTERVAPIHLESDWSSTQLIERLYWAVQDAAAVEREDRAAQADPR
jgi:hypothetical protein